MVQSVEVVSQGVSPARRARWLLALGALALACGGAGQYVWIDQYSPRVDGSSGYVVSAGDVISVRVWNQEGMSARARVRPDGMISMPFINDVAAAGREPTVLAKIIQGKLKEFIVNPVVTVSVEEQRPQEISVLGEVVRPGVYKIEQDTDLLKVLANAGGLTQVAGRDRIFVLRYGEPPDPQQPLRIRFTYPALTQAEGKAARFRLRAGDVVVVE